METLNTFGKQIETIYQSLIEMSEKIDGLNMINDRARLATIAENLRKGVFIAMVLGTFKNGKSTLLNALIGSKLLPSRTLATTAVITFVVYGKDKDKVKVYYMDKQEPEQYSIDGFNEKFRLRPEDAIEIDKTGYCERFSDVQYAVMETEYPLCQNGVRLCDSPGLEERASATQATLNFVPQSNVVLFVLSATNLFSEKEREYVRVNFAKKQAKNVFFIINRINQIDPEEKNDVMDSVRVTLKDVFVDEKGKFDETFYKKRVFFVNALGALNARKQHDDRLFKESGVAAFEKELEVFLMSDDKKYVQFRSALENASSAYANADRVMNQKVSSLQRPLKELLEAKAKSDVILAQQEEKKEALKKRFEMTSKTVYYKLIHSLHTYISTMESSWETDSENIQIEGFGTWSAVKSVFVNEETREQLYMPIAKGVEKYIRDKMEVWKHQAKLEIKEDVDLLAQEVESFSCEFDMEITRAINLFAGCSTVGMGVEGSKSNVWQALTGVIVGDLSVTAAGALGIYSWDRFIMKIVTNVLITAGIFLFLGNFIGVIVALIVEVFQLGGTTKKLRELILQKIRTKLFKQLTESIFKKEHEMEESIRMEMMNRYSEVAETVNNVIAEIKKTQSEIIRSIREGEVNISEELTKQKEIRGALRQSIKIIYRTIYSQDLTEEMFNRLITK